MEREMEMKLEVVPIPVRDVDAAKDFYTRQVGFRLDHDVQPGGNMRVVQMTPPGSACSVVIGVGLPLGEPGSVKGVQLVVEDLDAIRGELAAGRGHQRGAATRPRRHARLAVLLLRRPRRQYLGHPGVQASGLAAGLAEAAQRPGQSPGCHKRNVTPWLSTHSACRPYCLRTGSSARPPAGPDPLDRGGDVVDAEGQLYLGLRALRLPDAQGLAVSTARHVPGWAAVN